MDNSSVPVGVLELEVTCRYMDYYRNVLLLGALLCMCVRSLWSLEWSAENTMIELLFTLQNVNLTYGVAHKTANLFHQLPYYSPTF
jgi:hypothetical protein